MRRTSARPCRSAASNDVKSMARPLPRAFAYDSLIVQSCASRSRRADAGNPGEGLELGGRAGSARQRGLVEHRCDQLEVDAQETVRGDAHEEVVVGVGDADVEAAAPQSRLLAARHDLEPVPRQAESTLNDLAQPGARGDVLVASSSGQGRGGRGIRPEDLDELTRGPIPVRSAAPGAQVQTLAPAASGIPRATPLQAVRSRRRARGSWDSPTRSSGRPRAGIRLRCRRTA